MRDMNEPINHNSSARTKFKQRIAGGAVLLIVLAIFLPFIFNHARNTAVNLETAETSTQTPSAPAAAPDAPAPNTAAPASQAVAAPSVQVSTPTEQTAPPASTQNESSTAQPADNPVVLPPPQASVPSTVEVTPAANPGNQTEAPAAAAARTATDPHPDTVNKAAPAAPVKKKAPIAGRWILQVGSFSSVENAQQLAVQLRARGFHAYTQRGANARVRVYIGPLTSLQQVQKVQEQIQSQFKVSALVREIN